MALDAHEPAAKDVPRSSSSQVEPKAILAALEPIWDTKPETARRLRGRIAKVLASARDAEDTRPNPALSDWLTDKLGKQGKFKLNRKTKERIARGHHPSMPYGDRPQELRPEITVGEFMALLRKESSAAAKALQFTILTAVRTGETIGARWEEIDLDRRLWVIPAARMKMDVKHAVPLSKPVLAIPHEMKASRTEDSFGPHPFVFPGDRPRQGLSNMALIMLMRRMKLGHYTVHGFRGTFRTWATEKERADYGVAESALAHKVGNAVSQAYDHSDRFELRVALMAQWAEWLEHDGREKTAEVVPLPTRAAE